MSQRVAMFCDIDDVCNTFEPIYTQRLLQSGPRQRRRPSQLSLSEIMTMIVYFHASQYRDFKHYDTGYGAVHLRPYFPALVSYSRFVELMPRALCRFAPICTPEKAAAPASPLSIPPRWRCVIPSASLATKSSTAMPPGANAPWGGILASNCT